MDTSQREPSPPQFPKNDMGISIPMAINAISGAVPEGEGVQGLSLSLESGGR